LSKLECHKTIVIGGFTLEGVSFWASARVGFADLPLFYTFWPTVATLLKLGCKSLLLLMCGRSPIIYTQYTFLSMLDTLS
jgi:hypothetical protein